MNVRDAVEHASQAERVVWPTPELAFDAQAQRGCAVHVGERPSLVLAIAPAQPREGPDVLDDLLLDVQPKPILVAIGPRRLDVGGADGAIDRGLVAAHVR